MLYVFVLRLQDNEFPLFFSVFKVPSSNRVVVLTPIVQSFKLKLYELHFARIQGEKIWLADRHSRRGDNSKHNGNSTPAYVCYGKFKHLKHGYGFEKQINGRHFVTNGHHHEPSMNLNIPTRIFAGSNTCSMYGNATHLTTEMLPSLRKIWCAKIRQSLIK